MEKIPMNNQKLSSIEKKEAVSCLENYKNAYVCRVCKRIYGSDLTPQKENGLCHLHNKLPWRKKS